MHGWEREKRIATGFLERFGQDDGQVGSQVTCDRNPILQRKTSPLLSPAGSGTVWAKTERIMDLV